MEHSPITSMGPRARSRSEIERLAYDLLYDHHLEDAAPVTVMHLCTLLGIDVWETTFTEPDLSGLIIGRDGKYTIYVNEEEAAERQRFTMAHELGHYWLHLRDQRQHVGFKDSRDNISRAFRRSDAPLSPMETEANQFAAALLMPTKLVRAYRYLDPAALAKRFGVSTQAMDIRLRSL